MHVLSWVKPRVTLKMIVSADKQRRYHWTSQLLKLCDYLSRDEGRAVIRLDVTHNRQVVLASVNLLTALLGCCECVCMCAYSSLNCVFH